MLTIMTVHTMQHDHQQTVDSENKKTEYDTCPSSLYTIAIEPNVVLYLISPGTGCGP